MNIRILLIVLFVLSFIAGPAYAKSNKSGDKSKGLPPGLQKNLMVYYSFDRDGGTRAVDTSGMDFHGVVQGAQYTEDGYSGGAMHFDGEDDVIQVTPELSLKAFTVAAWVKPQRPSLRRSPGRLDAASIDVTSG